MTTVLLCRSDVLPVFEPIIASLINQGYKAALRVIVGDPAQLLAAEIDYEPNRMPIVVRVGPDFVDDPDASDFAFWQIVSDHKENRPKVYITGANDGSGLFGGKKAVHYFRDFLLSELAQGNENTLNVRRFIYIHAMDNVDSGALQTVVSMLREQSDAL